MAKVSQYAKKMEQIALHLQQRFMERHGIELTKQKRLALLHQIQDGVAKKLFVTRDKRELYRVVLQKNYVVMYCPLKKRIVTVLPDKNTQEYADFVSRTGLPRDIIERREMTPQERTDESIRRYREQWEIREAIERREESMHRLQAYQSSIGYFWGKDLRFDREDGILVE